jgi:hypothetical protein
MVVSAIPVATLLAQWLPTAAILVSLWKEAPPGLVPLQTEVPQIGQVQPLIASQLLVSYHHVLLLFGQLFGRLFS